MILLAGLFCVLTIFISFSARRSWPYLWFSLLLVLFYHVDAYFTNEYGYLFFSGTYPRVHYSEDSLYDVVLQATAVVVLISVLNVIFGRRTKISGLDIRPDLTGLFLPVSFVLFCFVLYVVFDSASKFSIDFVLNSRQMFFEGNLLASIALYTIPALIVVNFCGYIFEVNKFKKYFYGLLFLLCVLISLLTGSRSAFILSAILPCVTYYVLVKSKENKIKLLSLRNFIFSIVVGVVIVLAANSYRDVTRGEQATVNLLVSPDIVALDATVFLLQSNINKSYTYLSTFTFFIPRGFWAEKPVSGNSYLTSSLFPERMVSGGAEITASLIGEAFINFGYYGVFSASILVFILIRLSDVFLIKGGVYVPLALVFIFRGSNILRGDVLNTVVPLFFAFIIFYAADHALRFRKGRLLIKL